MTVWHAFVPFTRWIRIQNMNQQIHASANHNLFFLSGKKVVFFASRLTRSKSFPKVSFRLLAGVASGMKGVLVLFVSWKRAFRLFRELFEWIPTSDSVQLKTIISIRFWAYALQTRAVRGTTVCRPPYFEADESVNWTFSLRYCNTRHMLLPNDGTHIQDLHHVHYVHRYYTNRVMRPKERVTFFYRH